MTIAERPPIFVPSGNGFKAAYSLTFTSDLSHLIYLLGSIQGSEIASKTLKVDNGANTAACTVTLRGQDIPVPAFAIQYIDCSKALDVTITAGSTASSITVEVLTYTVAEQVITKKNLSVGGLPPVAVTGSAFVYWAGTKIVSIGAPITSYLNLTNDGSSTSVLRWGFDVGLTGGAISIGGNATINFDASTREFWIGSVSPNTCQTYWNGG